MNEGEEGDFGVRALHLESAKCFSSSSMGVRDRGGLAKFNRPSTIDHE